MGEFCLRAIKMKISSVSNHYMETSFEPNSGFESPLLAIWKKATLAFRKLDRLLTAISYAEAGNLDMVKEMLEQNKAMANERFEKISASGNSK